MAHRDQPVRSVRRGQAKTYCSDKCTKIAARRREPLDVEELELAA